MRLLALLLLLVLPATAVAGEPAASSKAFAQGRLWRIEAPGGGVGYLFGTMHISHPAVVQDLPKPVLDAFAASRVLALEINILRAKSTEFTDAMLLPAGESLSRIVGAELGWEIKRALAPLGLASSAVERLTPWAASFFLTTSDEESRRRKVGMKPLDLYLQLGAERAGMRIEALETMEEHMAVFTQMPRDLQTSMLRASLESRGLFALAMEEMLALYLAGDLDGLWAYYEAQNGDRDPAFKDYFRDAMLVKRNRAMIERARPLLDQGGVFIAVGALHLAGPDSMLAMLAAAGYGVTRAD